MISDALNQRPNSAARSGDDREEPNFLDTYLAPFLDVIEQPDVTDIYINRTGEIWVERLGGICERHSQPELDDVHLWRLARQIANLSHQAINRSQPLLSARLPDGSRVQIVAPPATRGAMAVAIRRHIAADLSLEDYCKAGAFRRTLKGVPANPATAALRNLYDDCNWGEFLRLAVQARLTILVSGGTSSGKTTFLNALLAEVDQNERLIVIEDTPELRLKHANSVGLVAVRSELGETTVTTDDLLIASLRMRPDRIILGELRGLEALAFLRAVNTGHPGSLSTIHANSTKQAVEQLALLVGQASSMRRSDIIAQIAATIDVFVQLENDGGQRRVASVDWPGRNC